MAVSGLSCTLMVVEDDADIREALTEILEQEGYQVIGAENGLEAITALRLQLKEEREPPGLILLDLMMPVMNGWQFRMQQAQDPELAQIPVVVVSADNSMQQRLEEIGACGFLRKPIELSSLLDMVAQYFQAAGKA